MKGRWGVIFYTFISTSKNGERRKKRAREKTRDMGSSCGQNTSCTSSSVGVSGGEDEMKQPYTTTTTCASVQTGKCWVTHDVVADEPCSKPPFSKTTQTSPPVHKRRGFSLHHLFLLLPKTHPLKLQNVAFCWACPPVYRKLVERSSLVLLYKEAKDNLGRGEPDK